MPSTVPFKNVSLFKTIQRFSTNYGYSLFNHFRAQLISKITHFLTAIIIYQQPYTIPHFRHLVYLSLGFVGIWYKPRLRCRGQLKCDGTRAETSFCLWAKRTSPFKSAGASVQSTTGSRSVRISGSNAGYTMIRSNVKGTGYPLHSPVSPSLPLPCITVCHQISTGLYYRHNGTALRHCRQENTAMLSGWYCSRQEHAVLLSWLYRSVDRTTLHWWARYTVLLRGQHSSFELVVHYCRTDNTTPLT